MVERTYDRISKGYAVARQADPRIAEVVHAGLVGAHRVVNVGAGTGNYEPADRFVVAVEPAHAMVAGRTSSSPVVRAVAKALPFPDGSFDAAMATLTLHHWSDLGSGLAEMRRVAPRQVVFLFDPGHTSRFWAMDYFPEALRDGDGTQRPRSRGARRPPRGA